MSQSCPLCLYTVHIMHVNVIVYLTPNGLYCASATRGNVTRPTPPLAMTRPIQKPTTLVGAMPAFCCWLKCTESRGTDSDSVSLMGVPTTRRSHASIVLHCGLALR